MVRFAFLGVLVLGVLTRGGGMPERPFPEIERVVVISLDGLRPDRALWADMPHLRSLAQSGAYTFWAKTTALAVTLPSHVSMLTGFTPEKHGVEWNFDLPLPSPVYPQVPTVFERAKRAGYRTGLVAGKGKMRTLTKPGTLSASQLVEGEGLLNGAVTQAALRLWDEGAFDFLFLHYPDIDAVGHAAGWGSLPQQLAIEETDRELGKLLAGLEERGARRNLLLLVTADHGGAGRGHGADDPRSRHIPWILQGPSVRPGFDLTQVGPLEVRTEDTAATVLYVLGLSTTPGQDGQPVRAAFLAAP